MVRIWAGYKHDIARLLLMNEMGRGTSLRVAQDRCRVRLSLFPGKHLVMRRLAMAEVLSAQIPISSTDSFVRHGSPTRALSHSQPPYRGVIFRAITPALPMLYSPRSLPHLCYS